MLKIVQTKLIVCGLLALLLGLYSVKSTAQWYAHSFKVMGTQAKVEFEFKDAKRAQQLIQAVVDEMNRIDHLMSPYKPASELSQINQRAASKPVPISTELFQLLQLSNQFAELTGGAFDISFSSVGYLYDYRNSLKQQTLNYHSIERPSYRLIKTVCHVYPP